MPKIVIDTNLFISVFVFRGVMVKSIFELVLDDKLVMYVSSSLLAELQNKFEYFTSSQDAQQGAMLFLEAKGIVVEPEITITASRDTKDNFLLELAETAQAEYLVTRDKDLLVLKKWKNTEIITPEDFLPLLRQMNILA